MDGRPQRVAGVEWVGVAPTLCERPRKVVDHRPAELDLHVVPGRTRTVVLVVELDHLRVTAVARVVTTTVAEVDPTDERDVTCRIGMLHDEELLVMTATASYAMVEQHLAAGE